MKQVWFCEKCGISGKILHEKDADVLSVVYAIENGHHLHSALCDQPIEKIRIVNHYK